MNKYFEHCEKISDLYAKTIDEVASKYNLTYMEMTIILFLYNNPLYNTASEIVKYRRLTKSHVSMSLKTLQNKGLISMNADDVDHRIMHIILSDSLIEIAEKGREVQKNFFNKVFEGFSKEDIKELRKYLSMINDNISRI